MGVNESFLLFTFVGFFAQLVDGALGMAYGVVSSSVLLSFGVAPALASASVHAAEVFTTGASASSHIAHGNVNWRLFWALMPAGVIGGVLGTYVLTSVDASFMRPLMAAYLGVMGLYILYRAWRQPGRYHEHSRSFAGAWGWSAGSWTPRAAEAGGRPSRPGSWARAGRRGRSSGRSTRPSSS